MKTRLLISTLVVFTLSFVSPLAAFSQDTSVSQQYRLQQVENIQASESAKKATPTSFAITFSEGNIIAVETSVILVSTSVGSKTIYTTDSTKYFNLDSAGKKLIGIGDLKTNEKIYFIGLSQTSNSGTAKIIVRDQTSSVKNFSLIGKVAEVNSTSLKVGNMTRTDLPNVTTTLNNETTFANSRSASLKISDILINDKVIISGYFNDKNNLITKQLFKISPLVTQTATSSAK